jgi:hypothetical protein
LLFYQLPKEKLIYGPNQIEAMIGPGSFDHSTFSKNHHGRFRESELFRLLFEKVVHLCMTAGLMNGEGFPINALSGAPATMQRTHLSCSTVRKLASTLLADIATVYHPTRSARTLMPNKN